MIFVLRKWERIDDMPKKVYLTTKGKGPRWESVVHRETYDWPTGELIASEAVTDADRDDKRRWHMRLPDPQAACYPDSADLQGVEYG